MAETRAKERDQETVWKISTYKYSTDGLWYFKASNGDTTLMSAPSSDHKTTMTQCGAQHQAKRFIRKFLRGESQPSIPQGRTRTFKP